MMNIELEKIKEKIAKLLAKAEGTSNDYEAAAFMGKVNALMEEYQLSMHEIRAAGADPDPLGKNNGEFNVYASFSGWGRQVISQLAKYYGAEVLWNNKRGNHYPYEVYGRDSARVTTELMIPYVISQVRRQAAQYSKDNGVTLSVAQKNVGYALTQRILKLLPEVEAKRSELSGKDLIPVSDVNSYMLSCVPDMRTKSRNFKWARSAEDYANRVSIDRQAGFEKRAQIGR